MDAVARRSLVLLAIVSGLLFFTKLDAPLLEPQEPRYAEIPRQMLCAGNFVVPVLHGEPYLDKPPLLYWLVMGSYTLFGVSDRAARFVPGCAGMLTVLVAYLWGRKVAGERAGLCGALILALSPGFVYRERMLTFDAVLCLWVTAALAAAHAALGEPPRIRLRWWSASAIACGLGLLTKGPVALALVAVPVAVHAWLERRTIRLRLRDGVAYFAIAIIVAAPWYVAIGEREPGFLTSFFWKHNVVRFLQPFDHEEPFWFYFPGLLMGLLPWGLLLPGLVRALLRDQASTSERLPAVRYFVLAAFWIVLFFSASGCKRSVYLLPAMPPLALALGWYLDSLLAADGSILEALRRGKAPFAGTLTFVVLVIGLAITAVALVKGMVKPVFGATAITALLSGAVVLARRNWQSSWLACLTVTFLLLYVGVRELQPAYNQQFALRTDLQRYTEELRGNELCVACYPQNWDSVTFYLPRADVRVYHTDERTRLFEDLKSRSETLLLVKPGRMAEDLLREMPLSMEFVTHGRKGSVIVGCVKVAGLIPRSAVARMDGTH
jgi:dolichol-phosphate mannosyltransferase